MKLFWTLLLACAATLAIAQEGRERGPGPRWKRIVQKEAPPGAMSWEERQRLRDELKGPRADNPPPGGRGPMREARRAAPMPPEERERLRRDIREANQELQRRR